jgi:hypothetical protein
MSWISKRIFLTGNLGCRRAFENTILRARHLPSCTAEKDIYHLKIIMVTSLNIQIGAYAEQEIPLVKYKKLYKGYDND